MIKKDGLQTAAEERQRQSKEFRTEAARQSIQVAVCLPMIAMIAHSFSSLLHISGHYIAHLTVAFQFWSSPLCYMLRFVSLPNKRRYIYIFIHLNDEKVLND